MHCAASLRAHQMRGEPNVDAGFLRDRLERRVCCWPLIGDRHASTSGGEVDGCRPRGVIVRCYQHPPPEDECIAIQIDTDRAGEHYAGEVVVTEKQWTLDGPFGVNNRSSTQRNQNLSCFAFGRVGAGVITPLNQHGRQSVINAYDRRAPKYLHVRHRRDFGFE